MNENDEGPLPIDGGPDAMTYSRAELEQMIKKMHAASGNFYRAAVYTGHHAFIEFTGLMNEYIKLCQVALDQGIDFTQTTIHGRGKALPMESFHQQYLSEKLSCIYGTSLDALMNPREPRVKKTPLDRAMTRRRAAKVRSITTAKRWKPLPKQTPRVA